MRENHWRIFKSHEDYESGMARLLHLAESDLQPNTDDFDEFELLSLLVGHYEETAFPMEKPDPIEAIKFRMDQQGLSQVDMRQYLGSASKVSEVLSKKRPLSLSMIRRLHDGLGIPADILIQDMKCIEWTELDSQEIQYIELKEFFSCNMQDSEKYFHSIGQKRTAPWIVNLGKRPKERESNSFKGFFSASSASVSLMTDFLRESVITPNNDEFCHLI